MDDCEDLIHKYLNSVNNIVDSFLSTSREKPCNRTRSFRLSDLVKKSLDLFSEIAEDMDNFNKFYEAFGKKIKLGIHEDVQNCSKLAEYLR